MVISAVAGDKIQEYGNIYKGVETRKTTELSVTVEAEKQTVTADNVSKEEDLVTKRKEITEKLKNDREIKLYSMIVMILYYVGFTLTKEQATPGQQILNLRTIRFDGQRITFFNALARIGLLFTFNILTPVCLFTKNNLAIHDFLSKTMVIEIK
jgi:hypothetical protein